MSAVEHQESSIDARFLLLRALPSYGLSFATHMVLLLIMALVTLPPRLHSSAPVLVAQAAEPLETLEEIEEPEMPMLDTVVNRDSQSEPSIQSQDVIDPPVEIDTPAHDEQVALAAIELTDYAERTAPKDVIGKDRGALDSNAYEGRGSSRRRQIAMGSGATDDSERAVALALKWLAAHQNADGSWNFNHRLAPACRGKCADPGRLEDCATGATAMALLPLLGAGQTHREGEYRPVVERGLYYLVGRMKVREGVGGLNEGGGAMYAHGLSSIVLCEAYAMTHDKALLAPAQLSLNFIAAAQDPVGGGWRYQPRTPGDTSVVGWQLMALKSGHLAYLQVDPRTIAGVSRFLDSVQADSGSQYGYTSPGNGPATSAIGLLCRMYLGWKQDHAALERGVQQLAAQGPSATNLYYDYYATQVMRHHGGEAWQKWNLKMRDSLVDSQSRQGHEAGSWHMRGGDHGSEAGGRIYCTSLATMILEVYYRHMPIYGKAAADTDFPL
jgi:hypothetical protein